IAGFGRSSIARAFRARLTRAGPVGAIRRPPLLRFRFPRERAPPGAPPVPDPRPRTLVEKIWDDHVVAQDEGSPSVLAIDLHLVHEVTSPQAFTGLRARGLPVRRPDRT